MKTINKFFFCTLALIMFSCDDIFEEDITDDMVQIISPVNNAEIESNVVNFHWNGLDGADKYRIQIYSSNQSMILDSLVRRESFTYALSGGDYQWRIRGENSAYESNYTFPTNFKMIESSDLATQQVILSTPESGIYTNRTNITCTWQRLSAADSYEVELINVTGGQNVVQRTTVTTTSVTFNNTVLTEDAEYQWKIKAVNETSETLFYSRNFNIDTVVPNQPQNALPATNTTQLINQPITFTWNTVADSGIIQSPIFYTIQFANQNTFTPVLLSSNSNTTSFPQTLTASGDYYWRIKATDAAGNVSAYSSPFKFTIN